MANNNYNQNDQTITAYVKNNSQTDRQKHIDLTSSCIPSVLTKDWRGKKAGDYTATQMGRINAKESLKDYLQLSGTTSRQIHACHMCNNDSTAPNGFVCMNPQHLYFGSALENSYDRPEDLRSKPGKVGGKAPNSQKQKDVASKICGKNAKTAMANGNHANQQTHTCPHCNKIGKGPVMKRYHFDNCKHKGISA